MAARVCIVPSRHLVAGVARRQQRLVIRRAVVIVSAELHDHFKKVIDEGGNKETQVSSESNPPVDWVALDEVLMALLGGD